MDISTVSGLIAFLGTVSFLGFFKSQVLTLWPWFRKQPPDTQSSVVLAASVFFGVVSYEILTNVPTAIFTQLQPLYTIIFSSVGVWLASQGYHSLAKAKPTITTTLTTSGVAGTSMKTTTEVDQPAKLPTTATLQAPLVTDGTTLSSMKVTSTTDPPPIIDRGG
jgi:hypothetical protein